jgi:hypothetical protein
MQNPPRPRPPRYHGSCPACNHGNMMPLDRFLESDVNEYPIVEASVAPGGLARMFPFWSIMYTLVTWLGNLLFGLGRARLKRGRAKVRYARAEILPRSPNSVICPNCYEVLERM